MKCFLRISIYRIGYWLGLGLLLLLLEEKKKTLKIF